MADTVLGKARRESRESEESEACANRNRSEGRASHVLASPDFAIAAYPGHLWGWTPHENPNFDLNPEIAAHITRQTPPTFLVQADDDHVDNVNDSLVYYLALKKAGVSVDMHLFAHGGHAFGVRHTDLPVSDWANLLPPWLASIGMLRAE